MCRISLLIITNCYDFRTVNLNKQLFYIKYVIDIRIYKNTKNKSDKYYYC